MQSDPWWRRVLVMLDESANVVLDGRLNETISTRAAIARAERKPWGCVLCGVLQWISPGHCDRALVGHEAEIEA